MKWSFRHLSHIMPIWIGMGGDYGTIACYSVLGLRLRPALLGSANKAAEIDEKSR